MWTVPAPSRLVVIRRPGEPDRIYKDLMVVDMTDDQEEQEDRCLAVRYPKAIPVSVYFPEFEAGPIPVYFPELEACLIPLARKDSYGLLRIPLESIGVADP